MMQAMQQETATQTLTKKQAAEFLGRSERSVSVYISKGELPASHIRGPHGTELAFQLSDLERLKADMQTPAARGVVVTDAATHVAPARLRQMPAPAAMLQPTQPISPPQVRDDAFERIIEAFTARPASLADLNVKPVLTIEEAWKLTGIPKACILAAVKDSSLRGFRGTLGRGWRMKRTDLDLWIAAL